MTRGRKKYICIDCKTRPVNLGVKRTGTFLCNKCYDLQNERLKSKVLDVLGMKPDEAIKLLNNLCGRFTSLPTKRVRKLVKVILDYNSMLRKDNRRLRNKLKREREK